MRKYTIKNWERAVNTLAKLSLKKKYTERFRLEYFQHLSYSNSSGKNSPAFLQNLLSFFNLYRFMLFNQLLGKRTWLKQYDFIVFISTNPSFIKTVLPVINLLLERKEKVIVLCGGNHYRALKYTLPESIFKHVYICESVAVSDKFTTFFKLIATPFLALADALWFLFQPLENTRTIVSNFARYALVHHFFTKSLIKQFNNKKHTIISASDYWFWESLYFTAAKETISESIVLQHGKLSDLYYPIFAKKFYAWGEADYKEMVENYNADPDEIVVTGSPYFDSIFTEIQNSTESYAHRNLVTYFSQPYSKHKSLAPESYREIINWLSGIKNKIPHLNLALKLHPFDNRDYYTEHLSNMPILEKDMMATLQQTKIMLTADSTSALEAAMAKIPVIQCLPQSQKIYGDMSSTGLTLKATTQKELLNLIDKLLHDKAFFENTIYASSLALNYYFSNLDHSLDNIAEQLRLNKN